ncbi:hypothetical protein [Methylosinus sp. PW1]|uniref:hypothetical protein n=1 Tax=Methylosinus sp. PW1 TaxID=107636 RepID=UPI0018DB8804|nr:hypothetical protein [Methylosinus sp. PW1]
MEPTEQNAMIVGVDPAAGPDYSVGTARCDSAEEARKIFPWANVFMPYRGGYMCFATLGDYQAYRWSGDRK